MWGNFQPGITVSETELKLWEGVHSKKKYVFSKKKTDKTQTQYLSAQEFQKK